MFYMAANISSMVNVGWFFGTSPAAARLLTATCIIFLLPGIPFNDSTNWRLTIAEQSQAIVGSHLLGLQAGNEPDFYQMCVFF